DKISGDKGADQIFYSQLGEGIDRLEDFSQEDKLVFNKTVFGNFSTVDFTSITVTSKTQDIGDADLLIFEGKGKDKNQSLDSVLDKLDDLEVGDRPVFALFSEKGNDNKLVFVDGETVDEIATLKNKSELEARNFLFVRMTENGEVDEQPLVGTDDDDSLAGSDDADTCYGGNGQDTLNGGGGGDTFIYLNINEGGDTIINFNINIDVLNFNSTTFGNITNQNFQSIVINNNTTSVGNANFLIFNQEIEVTNLLTILGNLGVNPNRPVFVSAPSEGDDSQTVLYFIQNQEVNIVANFNQNLVLNVNNFNFDNDTSLPDNEIIGTTAKDILKGTAGNDTIKGLADNDRISGDNGNDYLLGGAGNDNLAGGTGNDSILGNVGNDNLYGQEGNDYLSGGHGFDHLLAGAGNDILLGGTGGDRLNGGAGNDSLIGGGGKDRFIFNTNEIFRPADFGIDRIADFKAGEDLILLDQRSFNALNSVSGVGFSVASEFAVLTTAVDKSSALIVYNENTGELFYNQNGNANGFGTGGKFAVLTNKPELTADSFQIRVV
ncbi:MAG: calcium-binding protein, partial [Microcoleaceae cyanobacterium]